MQKTNESGQSAVGTGQKVSLLTICKTGKMMFGLRRSRHVLRSHCATSVVMRTVVFAALLLTAHCILPTASRGQEVVDKMVATVNAGGSTDCGGVCLITYSDLLWQLALQPDTPLDNPSSADKNRALRLVIDQRLILQEAEKLPSIEPSAEEIRTARDELVKNFASPSDFQQRLQRVGLTAEKLDEILDQRLRIEKYLDFRFRNFVVITQQEVADYYRDVYVPRLRARAPGKIVPTLEEARGEIERTLQESKIETDTDAFLDTARERAEIVTLNPV